LQKNLQKSEMNPSNSDYSGDDRDANVNSRRSSTIEYEQEPFETYQHKVAQLCRDIGYGKPSKVERMRGGGYNRVIGLTFPSGQQHEYILRIPRSALDEVERGEIKDQVAVALYLSRYDFLHVPAIAAFDTTVNNVIKSQYVLQERIDGIAIQDIFYTLPISQKLEITTVVAKMLIQLETVTLEKPGRLVGTGDLSDLSHVAPTSANEIKITGYRNNPVEDMPLVETQPLTSFITSLLEIRKQKNLDWDEMVVRCGRLQAIAKEMEEVGLMRPTDSECVLWHWDLSASNVMIRRASTTTSKRKSHLVKGCKHAVQINVEEENGQGAKHSIQVQIEDPSMRRCHHKVQLSVEDPSGRTYRHMVEITSGKASDQTLQEIGPSKEDVTSDYDLEQQGSSATSLTGNVPEGNWVVSGVLDWDDAMSVPLVLARKPPSWLWLDEENRDPSWTGNRDVKPKRLLTEDELLIKAHFDHIMARASPSYIEDTYRRGPWLRALARFAIYNFEDGVNWNRYDGFVEEWEEYYEAVAK